MTWTAHLLWGAVTALIPIITIGVRYIREPGLNESLIPFQWIIVLPFIFALVNLLVQLVIAPWIKISDYASYTNLILGVIIGLIYGLYFRYIGNLNIPQNLWGMKNPDNIYLSMIFYWTVIYALVLPFLQRQLCLYGPRGY